MTQSGCNTYSERPAGIFIYYIIMIKTTIWNYNAAEFVTIRPRRALPAVVDDTIVTGADVATIAHVKLFIPFAAGVCIRRARTAFIWTMITSAGNQNHTAVIVYGDVANFVRTIRIVAVAGVRRAKYPFLLVYNYRP